MGCCCYYEDANYCKWNSMICISATLVLTIAYHIALKLALYSTKAWKRSCGGFFNDTDEI